MLKLSTKSSYGLRACIALANAEDRLSSTEIATRENIPQRYLEQILSALRKGGLVTSTRGAQGGYSLSRPAEEITVAALVGAVEGAMPPILCTVPELQSDTCRTESNCGSRELCCRLEESMSSVLESTTVAKLAQQHKKSLKDTSCGDVHSNTTVASTPTVT